ncbi:MAG: anaerobic sulfatase maturase [Thiobacillaceae bacterium]
MPASETIVPFGVVLKPFGATCNLACRYCFYRGKAALYPGSDGRMAREVLETYTRDYLACQPPGEVTFAWQGGEPTLLGVAFFEEALALQQRYRRPDQRVVNALQTNGTLLDDEWGRFLRQNHFLVGLSLDGPQEMHDAHRRDAAGRPTWERVVAGLQVLRRHGVQFNVLATVHAANAGRPQVVYRYLRDEAGAGFIQFIPIVEREPGGRVSERSVSGPAFGAFLSGVFDEWLRRDVGRVFVQAFDAALASWLGEPPGVCVHAETCGTALALEHNGDLYACDHFVDGEHRLGNILEQPLVALATSEQQRRFGQDKRDALPSDCRRCPALPLCRGGCPKDRLLRTPKGEPGLNWLCAGYRAFYEHSAPALRSMAEELRRGSPRRISAGRNDPCPCGSGLKFKLCCGRAVAGPGRP